MRFAGAVGVGVLAVCAGTALSVARAQQPPGLIQPVVATIDASAGPLGHRPLAAARMPSHVAGHLADRLQALHDTSAAASADRAEMASRTSPPGAATAEWKPAAALPPTSQSASSLPVTSLPVTSLPVTSLPVTSLPVVSPVPQPAPAPAPRRNPLAGDRPSFGIANPLRSAN